MHRYQRLGRDGDKLQRRHRPVTRPPGSAGNGSYIEIDFSMTNYAGLSVSFPTRGTSDGYTSGLWSWSVNGGPFTTLAGVNTAAPSTTFTNATVDFTGVRP